MAQPWVAVFLGPPGCGKGTAAGKLKDRKRILHISSGDLLRAAVAAGSPIGGKVSALMENGELVPDEIVLELIAQELHPEKLTSCDGIVFDGYPRSVQQAEALATLLGAHGLVLNAVLFFGVPEAALVKRICGRRIHPASGRSYHIEFNKPKMPGVDDVTGEPLIQRKDDSEEALKERLKGYHSSTMPLLDYYRSRQLLRGVDAAATPEAVFESVKIALPEAEGRAF